MRTLNFFESKRVNIPPSLREGAGGGAPDYKKEAYI